MIFDKKSIFDIKAGIDRHDDIWPEMDSLGVLEVFCTKNRYPNAFRSNFKPFSKNQIFCHFHLWDSPISAPQNILWVSKFLHDIRNRFSYLKSVSDSKGGGYLVEFLAITTLLWFEEGMPKSVYFAFSRKSLN